MPVPDLGRKPTPDDARNAFDIERAEHCRHCRYCLHGLPADAPCPECASLIRQTGPHRILESNNLIAIWSIAIAIPMIVAACAGFWPAALTVPFLGLTAVIYGVIESRRRHALRLPRSRTIMLTNILGSLLFLLPLVLFAI